MNQIQQVQQAYKDAAANFGAACVFFEKNQITVVEYESAYNQMVTAKDDLLNWFGANLNALPEGSFVTATNIRRTVINKEVLLQDWEKYAQWAYHDPAIKAAMVVLALKVEAV